MTSKQFYFILAIFVITLKIQKMPCIIYEYLEKDSYIVFVIFMFINILEITLAYYIAKKINSRKDDKGKQKKLYDVMLRICGVFIAGYFLMQGMLFYEAIQDLFSHILFDNLSWKLFSLFLLGSVFYLASFNFDNIGRVCEIFFPIIIFSLVGLSVIGLTKSDMLAILPFDTIKNENILECLHKFNFWFGNFFIVLFLGSRTKNITFRKTMLTYLLSMFFVIFLVIEFNGIYYDLAAIQPSLISILSEQALLGIDIGRIDWFLILISEIGTAICSALCLCMAKHSFSYTFKKVNPNIFLTVMVVIYYLTDIWYLVDLNVKEKFFMDIVSKYSIAIKVIVMVLLIIKVINLKMTKNKQKFHFSNDGFKNLKRVSLKNNKQFVYEKTDKLTSRADDISQGFSYINFNNHNLEINQEKTKHKDDFNKGLESEESKKYSFKNQTKKVGL
ncbi:MAG: GerAB/ArcD/ProY family transporter [Clostridia bacterium]|nr:GerAB/ArcD/ProY family transporter [Clostridia bacterium]